MPSQLYYDDEISTDLVAHAANFVERHQLNIFQMHIDHGISTFKDDPQKNIRFYSKDPVRRNGRTRVYMMVSPCSPSVMQVWQLYKRHLNMLHDPEEQRLRKSIINVMKVKECVSNGTSSATFMANWDEESQNKEEILAEFKFIFDRLAFAMIAS